MKKFMIMMMRQWSHSPMKMILTLIAVALGSFILILAFNVTEIIDEQVETQLNNNGIVVQVANGTWDADGDIDQTRPSEWDSTIQSYLISDTDTIEDTAIVSRSIFNEITVSGTSYDLRNSIATEGSYFDIYGLEIVAGVEMTDEDLNLGSKKVWISKETAEIIFGTAENAVGEWVQPPGDAFSRGLGNRTQNVVTQYLIAGVYEIPSEITRKVYGIGDLLVPYTAILPSEMSSSMAKDMLSGMLVVKSSETSVEEAEQTIKQVIYQNYGEDIDVEVWEGSMQGETTYMNDLRKTVQVFTVSVNILGLVLMLVSTLGVFSIMLVEALSRKRQIALERSLGASKNRIIKEFWSWSMAMCFLGVVIGAIIAYFAFPSILQTITPLFGELSNELDLGVGFSLLALAKSSILILVFGGMFGVIPVIPVVKENIAEGLKEV
ncbi:MAG: ABC transporter permease [Sphaerochaetaceae bacterium]|nr:ABC transporter permease [Sphaerochaetaceae bacterium]MDC7250270.1 ABC transporter permease [Sphaerochaetaceae bacterium]